MICVSVCQVSTDMKFSSNSASERNSSWGSGRDAPEGISPQGLMTLI